MPEFGTACQLVLSLDQLGTLQFQLVSGSEQHEPDNLGHVKAW